MSNFNLGRALEGAAYGTINEILADFRTDDGYAITSRFEVVIHPPTGTRGNENLMNVFAQDMQKKTKEGVVRRAGLRCSQIDIPQRDVETVQDVNIYGPVREIATGVTYANLTATFQCSTDLRERQLFETWQRLSYNPQTWAMQYYDQYTGSLDIYQLDTKNLRKYGVRLVECFPKTVAAQTLSAEQGTLQTVQVTFAYRYWKSLADEADLPKPLGDRVRDVLGNVVERQILSNIPKVLNKL
tara:strand:- start:2818 stop:3543 length:726 start_codon:yes stop_codon:yes gene_type:complete